MDRSEQGISQHGQSASELDRARGCYARRAWDEAYESLAAIERASSGTQELCIDDLERLAMSAAASGRDDACLSALERVYQAATAVGDQRRAARASFWATGRLRSLDESGRASGWIARCQRIVERCGED